MFRFLVLSILILTATISFGHKCYDEADPDCENESDIKCVNCECINCKNEENNCVSGDMQVVEQTKGIVRVSQLSEDDVIIGIMGAEQTSTWCKVTAIFPAAHGQNRITHDGFTPGHMVLNSSVHVQPYGHKGEVRNGPVFTLATDCDATLNVEGRAFTPISTDFCPHELSWSEYLSLIGAIRRVTSQTGNFWFDLDAYHDNDTAMVPRWIDQAPAICREILRCAREEQCQKFEQVMQGFVFEHLNSPYLERMLRLYPNLGSDVNKVPAGTISEVVRSHDRSSEQLIVALIAAGGAMMLLLIIAVAVLLYRRRAMKKKATDDLVILNQKQLLVQADDLNA